MSFSRKTQVLLHRRATYPVLCDFTAEVAYYFGFRNCSRSIPILIGMSRVIDANPGFIKFFNLSADVDNGLDACKKFAFERNLLQTDLFIPLYGIGDDV